MIKSVSTELEPIQEDPEYDSNFETLQLNYKELEIIGKLSPEFIIIRILDLSHNLIYSLDGIEALKNLQIVDLSYNKLDNIAEFNKIPHPGKLRSLKVHCNPLTNDPDYRNKLQMKFESLVLLDKLPLGEETRATNMAIYSKFSSMVLPFLVLLERDMTIVEKLILEISNQKSSLEVKNTQNLGSNFNLKKELSVEYNENESSLKHVRADPWRSEDILNVWNAITNLARTFKICLERSYVKASPTSRRGSQDSKPSKESTLSSRITKRESKNPLSLIKEFLQFLEVFFQNFEEIEFRSIISFKRAYEDMFRLMTLEYSD